MRVFDVVPMVTPGTANTRLSDPITSHEAMDSHFNRAQVEGFVLGLFAKFGPMTDEELRERYFAAENHPPAERDTPRKRRSDLAKAGMVAWGIPQPFPPVSALRGVA